MQIANSPIRLTEPRAKESLGLLRNLLHLVLSPLALALYSLVALASLHELALRGKEVCTHVPARKNHLPKPKFALACNSFKKPTIMS